MKTAFLLSTGTFRGDLLTKKSNILSLSDVVGELLDLFRKSIDGVVKTAFLLSTGTFRGDLVSKKNIILSLSDVVGELLDLFRKSIGGVVKFCNYVSIETLREKNFSQKNKVFQKKQRFCESFSKVVEWISLGLSKLHSECPLGTFSRKILFRRKNLSHLNFANRAR